VFWVFPDPRFHRTKPFPTLGAEVIQLCRYTSVTAEQPLAEQLINVVAQLVAYDVEQTVVNKIHISN